LIGVLLRLQAMTLRGRLVRSLRLLRQPKYLVGALAVAAWMALWVGGPLLRSGTRIRTVNAEIFADEWLPAIHLVAALVITVAMLIPWLLPWGRLGLPFREAELTLLLQAPLTRRQVIWYGLLKSAVGTVLTAFFLSLVLGGGSGFLGLLLVFVFWDQNSKWRGLFLLRQRELPAATAGLRRALMTGFGGAFLLTIAVLALGFVRQLIEQLRSVEPEAVQSFAPAIASSASILSATPWPPALIALLQPGRLITAPIFAQGPGALLLSGLPVLALAAIQLELVLRSRARFEESALERARKTDVRKATRGRGKRIGAKFSRGWRVFPLPSAGSPAVAVLWKNLMRVSRLSLVHGAGAVALLLGLVALVPAVLHLHIATYGIPIVAGLVTAATATLFAGLSWRNDLRAELAHLELVRTWPVAPTQFVLAQVASPALLSFLLSVMGLGLTLAGILGSRLAEALWGDPSPMVLGVAGTNLALSFAGVLPVLAGAAFAVSAMLNTMAIIAPAWLAESSDSNKGIAAFGQRLLLGTFMFLGFGLALVPSAALVGLALLVPHLIGIPFSAWMLPLLGLMAATPLFVGGGLLVAAAGRMWEKLDASVEVLEIGR